MDIREEIKVKLTGAQLIDKYGAYNNSFIKEKSKVELIEIIEDCFENLDEDLEPQYKILSTKFKTWLLSRILGIKLQELNALPIYQTHITFITSFLTRIAEELIGQNIELITYSKMDGVSAYNVTGTNKVFVNTKSFKFQEIIKFYNEYQTSSNKGELSLIILITF